MKNPFLTDWEKCSNARDEKSLGMRRLIKRSAATREEQNPANGRFPQPAGGTSTLPQTHDGIFSPSPVSGHSEHVALRSIHLEVCPDARLRTIPQGKEPPRHIGDGGGELNPTAGHHYSPTGSTLMGGAYLRLFSIAHWPTSMGLRSTLTPADCSASVLPCTVPADPRTMAPA